MVTSADRIISVEERAKLLEALDGSAYQVSAGGSLANTLVAASHLSRADHCNRGGGLPRIGMLSVSGDDLQVRFVLELLCSLNFIALDLLHHCFLAQQALQSEVMHQLLSARYCPGRACPKGPDVGR